MQTVVGIDLGTQRLKIVFYDFSAHRVIAAESSPLRLIQNSSGIAEQRAQWWIDALQAAFAKVDQKVLASVVAVGVSGQQHGFVPMDSSGEVLSTVKLWCDTTTEAECQEIMQAVGGEQACHALTGNRILPGYTASKILWFRKTHPELYRKMATILLPHDYLNFYLTGELCMEAGDASGTGLLDVRQRQWSAEILGAIDSGRDLSDCLPVLRTDPGVIGMLSGSSAETLGLPPATPVATGGGDNMMAAIGTGNISPGKITMSLGTSGTVYAYADHPVVDPSGAVAAFCSSTGGWLPLLCTMNCTVATETMRQLLGTGLTDVEALAGRASPGSDGVITLPFYNGERSPNLPAGKACVIGLDSLNSRPGNLLRSAMEGASYGLRFGIGKLNELGVTAQDITLTGGGANSATWRQVLADVCDTPITILQQNEGAAFGAALQALAVTAGTDIGAVVAEHVIRDEGLCCEPNPQAVRFYQDAYRDYQTAVTAVSPLFSHLSIGKHEALP
ncbi:MAG: xylulokinase [Gammaproteobacteria bacterium]|nr:xylulokinase [Gammaproteobacteria bacterium]